MDSEQNRLNVTNTGNYRVWDINDGTDIANLDMVLGITWKKINIPSSIHAKYQIHDSVIIKDENKEPDPINNNLLIPYMSAMVNLPHHLILGSVNGDLHIVKESCLEGTKFF